MSKSEYMRRHGLTLRPVTPEDRAVARTDYQRDADYIITDGTVEWFSMRGTLSDMKRFVEWNYA